MVCTLILLASARCSDTQRHRRLFVGVGALGSGLLPEDEFALHKLDQGGDVGLPVDAQAGVVAVSQQVLSHQQGLDAVVVALWRGRGGGVLVSLPHLRRDRDVLAKSAPISVF